MATLLLRYSAPLAAFGHTARFDNRPSAATPTLSGIQGLLAAAAGVGRATPWPDWIAALHLAVRVEHAGTRITDYHTVNQPPARRYRDLEPPDLDRVRVLATAEGTRATFNTFVTRRGYLTDATFLLAVEDPTGHITEALTAPLWALYAGRKSCPLTEPFVLGRAEITPEQAVATVPTVPHPIEADRRQRDPVRPGDTVVRHALLFTQPTVHATHEDRNDRAVGFKQHRPQRRWHTDVTVPVAADWFDVIDHLATPGAPA
jgi:CRISPR system Cascade subunit CasD